MNLEPEEGSFRDPDGRVLYGNGNVYRLISPAYSVTWKELNDSGLPAELLADGRLIGFSGEYIQHPEHGTLIVVDRIPFISYPNEWSPAQLQQAALLTLDIQLRALDSGFTLKDASAYNVQFLSGKPVFIDLVSFERYADGSPWAAYGQFCRHFLAPLLLTHYGAMSNFSVLVAYPDGLPLSLCAWMLPARSKVSLLAATHIHLHARFERKYAAGTTDTVAKARMPVQRLKTMLKHMRDGIASLRISSPKSNWTDYYEEFSYTKEAFDIKAAFVTEVARQSTPAFCLDLGCNTGEFSLIAAGFSELVVACDQDESALAKLVARAPQNVLPLRIDLMNPTPSFGWSGHERRSFLKRVEQADLVIALALVHHLCLANNVPLEKLAAFFSVFSGFILVEFVPRSDPQAQRLLVSRKDIFTGYTEEEFRRCFSRYFAVLDEKRLPGSERVLFYMRRAKI